MTTQADRIMRESVTVAKQAARICDETISELMRVESCSRTEATTLLVTRLGKMLSPEAKAELLTEIETIQP